MIQKDIDLTRYLVSKIDSSNDFIRCNSPDLAIVCFRYTASYAENEQDKIDELNAKIIPALEDDGRVFITGTILHDPTGNPGLLD